MMTTVFESDHDPRVSPRAWEDNLDMFVAAALTGIVSLAYDARVEMYEKMDVREIAAMLGIVTTEQLYGPRPGGNDDTE